MNRQSNIATNKPGINVKKNAILQSNALASATSTSGASTPPNRPVDVTCMKPMLNPLREGVDSIAMTDCAIGRNGPSNSPTNNLSSNSIMKPVARPCAHEIRENTTTNKIKMIFLFWFLSAMKPTNGPETAQANDT